MTELNDAPILVVGRLRRPGPGDRPRPRRPGRPAGPVRAGPRPAARPSGSRATHVVADLREPGAAERIVAEAEQALGGLTGVVYAAGVVAFGAVGELDDDDVDELLLLNYLAPARVAAAALPRLGARRVRGQPERGGGRAAHPQDGGVLGQQGRADRVRPGGAAGGPPPGHPGDRHPAAAHRDRPGRPADRRAGRRSCRRGWTRPTSPAASSTRLAGDEIDLPTDAFSRAGPGVDR